MRGRACYYLINVLECTVDAIFRKDRNVACKNISIVSISMMGDGEKKFVLL
ncbi:Uncharacterised protein [uncultured archaeon]|nr:Uncharacterised protein [uncultured archaeon]